LRLLLLRGKKRNRIKVVAILNDVDKEERGLSPVMKFRRGNVVGEMNELIEFSLLSNI